MGDLQMKPLMEEKKRKEIQTGFGEQQQQEVITGVSPYVVDERWQMPEQKEQGEYEEPMVQTESVKEILEDTATTKQLSKEDNKKGAPPLFGEGEPNLQDIKRKQDSRNASMLAVLAKIVKAYPAYVKEELLEEDHGNPMRVFVTLHDPNGNKVRIGVMKDKKEGDDRALWVQIVEKAVSLLMQQYEGGARQDMYAGLSDTNKLSSEERKEAKKDGGESELKAGVMLFMGKRGLTMMGLDNKGDDNGDGGEGAHRVDLSVDSIPTAEPAVWAGFHDLRGKR